MELKGKTETIHFSVKKRGKVWMVDSEDVHTGKKEENFLSGEKLLTWLAELLGIKEKRLPW
jgi:hypothetical protein